MYRIRCASSVLCYRIAHPEKCFVESTKIWLAQQKFSFNYGLMEILFELSKKILLIFFCNSNKKKLHPQQKIGIAN